MDEVLTNKISSKALYSLDPDSRCSKRYIGGTIYETLHFLFVVLSYGNSLTDVPSRIHDMGALSSIP